MTAPTVCVWEVHWHTDQYEWLNYYSPSFEISAIYRRSILCCCSFRGLHSDHRLLNLHLIWSFHPQLELLSNLSPVIYFWAQNHRNTLKPPVSRKTVFTRSKSLIHILDTKLVPYLYSFLLAATLRCSAKSPQKSIAEDAFGSAAFFSSFIWRVRPSGQTSAPLSLGGRLQAWIETLESNRISSVCSFCPICLCPVPSLLSLWRKSWGSQRPHGLKLKSNHILFHSRLFTRDLLGCQDFSTSTKPFNTCECNSDCAP